MVLVRIRKTTVFAGRQVAAADVSTFEAFQIDPTLPCLFQYATRAQHLIYCSAFLAIGSIAFAVALPDPGAFFVL